MLKALMPAFALVLVVGVAPGMARAETAYHYWARVPATASSCADEAAAMAARFASATAISQVHGTCVGTEDIQAEGNSYPLYSLDVAYRADGERTARTTTLGSGVENGYTTGSVGTAYLTYAECAADIAPQTTLYTAQTGVTAVAAFCLPNNIGLGPEYDMEIQGFGAPRKTLQAIDFDRVNSGSALDPNFQAASVALIVKKGGAVARITDGAIAYYASHVSVSHDSVGAFKELFECQAQQKDAETIFKKVGATTVVTACLTFGKTAATFWSLDVVYDGTPDIAGDFGYGAPKYFSFDECMKDRARALRVIAQSNDHVLGGICHGDDVTEGQYVFETFSTF